MHTTVDRLTMLMLCLATCVAFGCGESSPGTRPQAGSGGVGGVGGVGGGGSGGAGTGAAGFETVGPLPDAAVFDTDAAVRAFDAGSDPARNHVVPGTLCERLSTIQCAAEAFCCDAPGRTQEKCKELMLGNCTSMLFLDAIAAEQITGFDETGAEQIFTHFEMMASQCDPEVSAWGASPEGLRSILRGTRNPGSDCAPEGVDPQDKVKAGAALASCTGLASTACLPKQGGLLNLVWTCAPRSAGGGDCFSDANCESNLYCDNPDLTLGAKCALRKPVGAACLNPNECSTLFCKGKICVASEPQAAYCLMN